MKCVYTIGMKHAYQSNLHAIIEKKYRAISSHLNERSRRIWAASEAIALGHGGKKIIHERIRNRSGIPDS